MTVLDLAPTQTHEQHLGDGSTLSARSTARTLWQLSGARSLGARATAAVAAAAELAFSIVSFAEIGEKAAIGKLTVPEDLQRHVAGAGLRIVGLAPEHGLAVAELPLHHRDPFDRLLVAQARHEGFTLVTADARMSEYDVAVLDALA